MPPQLLAVMNHFRDKLERWSGGSYLYFHSKYGEDIVRRFRPAAIKKFGSDFFGKENNFGAPIKPDSRRKEQPIFWEFVQSILTAEK